MDNNEIVYTLPEGWIWTTLDLVSKNITDGSHNPPSKQDSGIPMLSARNIENGKITFDEIRYISERDYEYENQRARIEAGDVLLTIVATIGRSAIIPTPIQQRFALQRSVAAIKPLINGHFLMYVFQGPAFQKLLTDNAKGTAQKGVYLKTLRELPIPLPPLEEQHRIVSKIEELFSELDHGEEDLKKAQKQLEVYKQALLKSAFEGNRREKMEIIVGQLGIISTGTTPSKSSANFYGPEYNFYKPSDLNKGYHVINSNDKLSELGFYSARTVPENSILVTCIGATIGKTGIVRKKGAFNQQINAIIPDENYLPEFIYYQIISPRFQKEIRQNASSTTLPIINKGKFFQLSFLSFSKNDQVEIVRELDSKFTLIENLEKSIDSGFYKLKLIRQIILKKALEGDLVFQNNEDEPASILLDRIQKEKELYISFQKLKQRDKPKSVKPMETKRKKIKEILENSGGPITSEQLWQESIYFDNIESFYAELKKIEHEIEILFEGKESSILLKR